MIEQINYTIYKDGEEHIITITPHYETQPNGDIYLTGVFKLTEGNVGLGDIVFDNHLKQWEYTGMGYLNHKDAAEIAGFIQVKDADDANNISEV